MYHYFGFFKKAQVARALHGQHRQLLVSQEELCLNDSRQLCWLV